MMFCSECLEPCKSVERNFGIGGYEFWGATGSDDNWQEVSKCCDGDLLTEEELQELDA